MRLVLVITMHINFFLVSHNLRRLAVINLSPMAPKQYLFKLCGGRHTLYDFSYPKTIIYGFLDNPSSWAFIPARSPSEAAEICDSISELDTMFIDLFNAQKAGHISLAKWYEDVANKWYHPRFIPYVNKYGEQFVPPSIRRQVCLFEEMCAKSGGILDVGRTSFTPLIWVRVPRGFNPDGSQNVPYRIPDEMVLESVTIEQFRHLCAEVIDRENWSDERIEYEFYSCGTVL